MKYILKAQVREWYGDEDHVGNPDHGRFKPKGGEEFIFEGDESVPYLEEELILKFNKRYDSPDRFIRYEAASIETYFTPLQAKMVDGEIIL